MAAARCYLRLVSVTWNPLAGVRPGTVRILATRGLRTAFCVGPGLLSAGGLGLRFGLELRLRLSALIDANCALQVLSDEVKRKQYDSYGRVGFDAGGSRSQEYWQSGPSVDPEELFRRIFGEFTGSGFRDFNTVFDQHQEYIMELTFTQAAKGVNKEITVNLEDTCQRCDGKGNEPGTKVQHCHYCNGSGMAGCVCALPNAVCACIAGVEDGQTVRMPVGRKEIFITFRIPAGVQVDQRIRLAGKGIPKVNSYGYGDHYIHIKVKIPKRLTARQSSLMLAYAEEENDVEGTVNGVVNTTADTIL
eukprot:g47340.t1